MIKSLFSSSHFVILKLTVTFLRFPLTQRPKSGMWTFHVKFLNRSCLLFKGYIYVSLTPQQNLMKLQFLFYHEGEITER